MKTKNQKKAMELKKAAIYSSTSNNSEKMRTKKADFSLLCFGSTVAPVDTISTVATQENAEETSIGFFLETLLPFIFAGFGMVGAGILFDWARSWTFFCSLPEAVVLVPALLGLKGNLEMTLGSRLSTQANLGKMNTRKDQLSLSCSNLSLVQAQAVFVSLSAALFTLLYEGMNAQTWKEENYGLLCLTSVATASIASLILGLFMIAVVLVSLRINVNPDNITTPIAASLGDMTTLLCMIFFGSLLLELHSSLFVNITILVLWVLFAIFCLWIASKDSYAQNVLKYGWYAILIAMLISSGSGMILKKAVEIFPNIAPFQPVMNGVGGNLVAIQASRFSTYLHKTYEFGVLPKGTLRKALNPFRAFFSNDKNACIARLLLMMVIPGQLIFIALIFAVEPSTLSSPLFIAVYLIASISQVVLLLYLCQIMVPIMWKYRIDPDNSAIPILTAMGDLLGIALLFIILICCHELSMYQAGNTDDSFTTNLTNVTYSTFQI